MFNILGVSEIVYKLSSKLTQFSGQMSNVLNNIEQIKVAGAKNLNSLIKNINISGKYEMKYLWEAIIG